MSREVRRVPVTWQHPTEPDEHGWTAQRPATSRLLPPGRRFKGLCEQSYADDLADFEAHPEDYGDGPPDPDDYMPTFEGDPDALGWCLYETVSDGTPTTPVFPTAEALIEHLCTVGEDYDQQPYRRAAAEALVGRGYSMGTFVVAGGRVLSASKDADLVAELGQVTQ